MFKINNKQRIKMDFAKRKIYAIVWTLVGIFIVLASYIAIPFQHSIKRAIFPLMAVYAITFFLLGIILIFLARKLKGKLKKFLILTGASTAGFLASVLLHNFLYALGVITGHIIILKYVFEILHVAFFIIAVFVCPIVFLVCAIGSIILFVKK